MDTKKYLEQYYANYDEKGRLFKRRSGVLEYETTMRYIMRYLKPSHSILEIGAGTGRYSLQLAELGYAVTAVELVEHNLNQLKAEIQPGMKIRAMQGNALDLSTLQDNSFDVTLVLGPMYHLFSTEDKHQALREALRVTKTGGVVFVAYCITDATIFEYGFRQDHIQEILDKGMLDESFIACSKPQDLFEMVRKSDIDAMMKAYYVQRLHYVATDGLSYFMRRELEEMTEESFRIFRKYHFSVCENPDLVGATAHSLDIFRKL